MLVASYEAIRFQKLDLFSVPLRQIGAQIGRMPASGSRICRRSSSLGRVSVPTSSALS